MADEQTPTPPLRDEAPEQLTDTQTMPDAAEQGVPASESSPATADSELSAALQQAEEEIAGLKDQVLRAAADVQNARRRAEQDVEKAHKFGLEKFVGEMLPIVDSLERAMEACAAEDEATQALKAGVEMTQQMFITALEKFNVEQVNPEGEPFKPELHQAMSMVEAPDAAPNTVVGVMQKGYCLNGRLIRPAMVMVAKG